MKDLRDLLAAWAVARAEGRRAVLATVVKVAGSTYRRPGARMLFVEGGPSVGLVSGGCLETDLARRAAEVLSAGAPSTALYDMRSPDDIVWGLGLGCDGEIRVLLEPLLPDGEHPALRFLEAALRTRSAAALLTVFDGGTAAPAGPGACALVLRSGQVEPAGLEPSDLPRQSLLEALERGRSSVRRFGGGEAWFECLVAYLPPRLRLWIFGAGADARPMAGQAAALGWQVEVFDHREAYLKADRFPDAETLHRLDFGNLPLDLLPADDRTAAVVMTHHFLHDVELIRALLRGRAPYVGLIGPLKRRETLMRELQRDEAPDNESASRLHGPVGLDIGAETPEEIALATVAEIQACFTGRRGGPLRERRGPLHDPAP